MAVLVSGVLNIAGAFLSNEAAKTISGGTLDHGAGPPAWVVAVSGLAIGPGTYLGGWRITRTMGRGATGIQPPQGSAAESASTTVIPASAHLGFALSTRTWLLRPGGPRSGCVKPLEARRSDAENGRFAEGRWGRG